MTIKHMKIPSAGTTYMIPECWALGWIEMPEKVFFLYAYVVDAILVRSINSQRLSSIGHTKTAWMVDKFVVKFKFIAIPDKFNKCHIKVSGFWKNIHMPRMTHLESIRTI